MKKIVFAIFTVLTVMLVENPLSVKAADISADISTGVYLYGPGIIRTGGVIEKTVERTEVIRETQISRTVIFRPGENTTDNLAGSGVMGDMAAPEGIQGTSPDTGDESKMEINIAAAVLSAMIMTIIILLLKRRRTENEKCNNGKCSKSGENCHRSGSDHGIIGGAVICREYIGR